MIIAVELWSCQWSTSHSCPDRHIDNRAWSGVTLRGILRTVVSTLLASGMLFLESSHCLHLSVCVRWFPAGDRDARDSNFTDKTEQDRSRWPLQDPDQFSSGHSSWHWVQVIRIQVRHAASYNYDIVMTLSSTLHGHYKLLQIHSYTQNDESHLLNCCHLSLLGRQPLLCVVFLIYFVCILWQCNRIEW